MQRYKTHRASVANVLLLLVFSAMLVSSVNAQYWFQFGVKAGNSAAFNTGASAYIQTITDQHPITGSLGFWIGENLPNGAFIQMGYVVENQSGRYPTNCTLSGCSNYEYISAGTPVWFYEYFPPNYNGGFLGRLGPNDSLGPNGGFNEYSFYSVGNTWYFMFNNNIVGSVNLGTSSSGAYPPVAFGELANASSGDTYINPVIFYNFSAYLNGVLLPVPDAYSFIGYGVGSDKALPNPYGVKEINNRINYFEVGSGLPQPLNGTELWHFGYYLHTVSPYGNISSTTGYSAYSSVQLSAPQIVYISKSERAVFSGWIGKGLGSYTGPERSITIQMDSNITETANWTVEYFVNFTSPEGTTYGSGWYSKGAEVQYGVSPIEISGGTGTRYLFSSWSNGNTNATGTLVVTKPENITAVFQKQFYVNATGEYGSVSGTGWYNNNTVVTVSVAPTVENISSSERYIFYSWSNGNRNASVELLVTSPIKISAVFAKQYLVNLVPENANGNIVRNVQFYVNGKPVTNETFLFPNASISSVYYNGELMPFKKALNISAPETLPVKLPLYNITIKAHGMLPFSVNAMLKLKFSNGTTTIAYTGASGVTLHNVPYGYINGTASYLGITQGINSHGGNITLTFLSIDDISAFAFAALAIIASYFISKHHFSRHQSQGAQVSKGNGVQ
ncbi:MAG: hypothetical protein ACP5TK_02780 [Candidatus Micrarchaeia archaeon]